MISNVLSTVTGVLDRRFIRNAFFPSLAFLVACAVVGLSARHQLGDAIGRWQDAGGPTQAIVVVTSIAAVWFFGAIVDSQTTRITQLYEGYWPAPFAGVAAYGKKRHREKLTKLRDDNKIPEVYATYPLSVNDVMPTRLGNILKGAERYPSDRYGANAIVVWPRLYPILPDSMIATTAQARASLEFLLVLSALASLFALASGIYLMVITAAAWQFAVTFGSGLVISIVAYRASLPAARVYAECLRVAFDLYRLDALSHLQLARPGNATEERQRWTEFNRLVVRNFALPQPYPPPPPAAPAGGP